MRIDTRKIANCLITLFFLFSLPAVCRADVLLSVSGVSVVEKNNLAKAEQKALQDAFAKAALQIAMKYVPSASMSNLVQILPEYSASRGMQDVIQYQITSRMQQSGVLQLSVDVKMIEEPLREWITSHALTTPKELRPRILLMISSQETGKNRAYEWWTDKAKSAYSPFESQLAQELGHLGENVIEASPSMKSQISAASRPLDIARAIGADLLLTGSISYLPVFNRIYECSLKLNMIDVRSQSALSSWSIAHKGDFSYPLMNSLIINEIKTPIRSNIGNVVLSHAPVTMKKSLCIEGISDYGTYQSMINSLKALGSVSRISVTSVAGHSICHALDVKGSLSDVMENLKSQKITEADIIVEDDKASVRILKN